MRGGALAPTGRAGMRKTDRISGRCGGAAAAASRRGGKSRATGAGPIAGSCDAAPAPGNGVTAATTFAWR